MYQEHESFDPPPPDAQLWRYFDFTKFVSLLDRSALFFSRVDKLGDPFEGSLSKINLAMPPVIFRDFSREGQEHRLVVWRDFSRYIAVNCWHWNEHESAAMWNIYARHGDGIAIKSSFSRLAESFTDATDIYIGQVNYVDYETTQIPEQNLLSAYLHKRKSFEHEREVRALIMDVPLSEDNGVVTAAPEAWEFGQYCQVNLSTLVQEVVVSPASADWFVELAKSVSARYALEAPVGRSALAALPP